MKKFDIHGDFFYDIAKKKIQGEKNIIKKYHLKRLEIGEIMGGIFITWFPPESLFLNSKLTLREEFKMMLELIEEELEENKDIISIIKIKKDFDNWENTEKLKVIKGVEGLRGIKGYIEEVEMLYKLGYRHCSLTWNEENELAVGINGNSEKGITSLGIEAIRKMEKLGMILDVSHLNEKSFWDVVKNSEKPFIASHSNCYSICPHKRNLKDEQILAIGKKKGLIGINAYRNFISDKEEEKTVSKLVDHIDYIVKLIGVESVALGLDFCEYLSGNPEQSNTNPNDMCDASQSDKIISELRKRGYSEKELEKISFNNIKRIMLEILKE